MRAARELRAPARPEVAGRCLAASLAFCRAARRHGVETRLVVWSVAGDREFLDHWAVMLANGLIVDLTRAQVDGRSDIVHGMAS